MNRQPIENDRIAAAQHPVLTHLSDLKRQRAEGVKRADGAAKGRQMQAIPGHWRSLQDTRKRTLTRGDSPTRCDAHTRGGVRFPRAPLCPKIPSDLGLYTGSWGRRIPPSTRAGL